MKYIVIFSVILMNELVLAEDANSGDFESRLKKFAEEGLNYAKEKRKTDGSFTKLNFSKPKESIFDMKKTTYSEELMNIHYDAQAFLHTGKLLVDALKIEKDHIYDFLSSVSLKSTPLEKMCSHEQASGASQAQGRQAGAPSLNYRSYDGSGNNLANPDWGKSKTPFRRILAPEYGDGINTPRGTVSTGSGFSSSLPSARVVSEIVTKDEENPFPTLSLMLMQWGQFLDHDLTETPTATAVNNSIKCCVNGALLPADKLHPECFPIIVPSNDTFYKDFTVGCLELVRSQCGLSGSCTLGVREQINSLTTFIDASNVYGNNEVAARELRSFVGGELRMNGPSEHTLLPEESSCGQNRTCFKAGDSRVNEQTDLAIMHTVWAREHNRIARIISKINPKWNDEDIYLETRKIVGAEMQHITYNEFLPIVLGKTIMEEFQLLPSIGHRNLYNSTLDPTISNAFSAAAYRFGHTLIAGKLNMFTSPGQISDFLIFHKQFNNAISVRSKDKFLSLVKGLNFQPAQKVDNIFTTSITEHLFETLTGSFGSDLVSRNIQRGRDHGIPSYSKWRKLCNPSWDGTFAGLESNIPASVVTSLRLAYNDKIDDVDLFIGGISESPYLDGIVGRTFSCIIADTFIRLRKADRFFYEESGPQGFRKYQLEELKKVTLSKVFCDNTGLMQYPKQAFIQESTSNPLVNCADLPTPDFIHWDASPRMRD